MLQWKMAGALEWMFQNHSLNVLVRTFWVAATRHPTQMSQKKQNYISLQRPEKVLPSSQKWRKDNISKGPGQWNQSFSAHRALLLSFCFSHLLLSYSLCSGVSCATDAERTASVEHSRWKPQLRHPRWKNDCLSMASVHWISYSPSGRVPTPWVSLCCLRMRCYDCHTHP